LKKYVSDVEKALSAYKEAFDKLTDQDKTRGNASSFAGSWQELVSGIVPSQKSQGG